MAHWSEGSGSIQPSAISSDRAALTLRRSTPKTRAIQEALTLPRPSKPPRLRERHRSRMPRAVAMKAGRAPSARNRSIRRGMATGPRPPPRVSSRSRPGWPIGSGKAIADSDHSRRPAATSRLAEALARLSETPMSLASSREGERGRAITPGQATPGEHLVAGEPGAEVAHPRAGGPGRPPGRRPGPRRKRGRSHRRSTIRPSPLDPARKYGPSPCPPKIGGRRQRL